MVFSHNLINRRARRADPQPSKISISGMTPSNCMPAAVRRRNENGFANKLDVLIGPDTSGVELELQHIVNGDVPLFILER